MICKALGDYVVIGCTLDDSLGESFDKAARLMGINDGMYTIPGVQHIMSSACYQHRISTAFFPISGYNCLFVARVRQWGAIGGEASKTGRSVSIFSSHDGTDAEVS